MLGCCDEYHDDIIRKGHHEGDESATKERSSHCLKRKDLQFIDNKTNMDIPLTTAIMLTTLDHWTYFSSFSSESSLEDLTTEVFLKERSDDIQLVKGWQQQTSTWAFLIMAIVASLGLSANTLVIGAFLKVPSLRKPRNYLVCNLAFADCLSSIFFLNFSVMKFTNPGINLSSRNEFYCRMSLVGTFLALITSLGCLTIMSGERLFAVILPLKHRIMMIGRNIKLVIFSLWLVIAVLAVPLVLLDNEWTPGKPCNTSLVFQRIYYYNVYVVGAIAATIAIIIANIIVAIIATRRKISVGMSTNEQELRKERTQRRITKMLLSLVCLFFVCTWPSFLIGQYIFVVGGTSKLRFIYKASHIGLALNAFANATVYMVQSKQYVKTIGKLFICKEK